MENKYINLTKETIDQEHLCCIIRTKALHPGVEAKRAWLRNELEHKEHVFRKLDVKGTVFIEFDDLDKSWTPIIGDNYLYIYYLWVLYPFKGKGYGKELLEYAINYAKEHHKSGLCMIGSIKQKNWLSNQEFAKRNGFEIVDQTNNGYHLLALSLDGTTPHFNESAKKESIEEKGLVIYYDDQCPFINENVAQIEEYCLANHLALCLRKVTTLDQAKALSCVFNNYAVFYDGKFVTVNLLDIAHIQKLFIK